MSERKNEMLLAASDSALMSRVMMPESIMSGYPEPHEGLPGIPSQGGPSCSPAAGGGAKIDYEAIRDEAEALREDLVRVRRDLRKHPETAFKEHRTAKMIKTELEKIEGVSHIRTGVAQTGVVCSIFGLLGEDPEEINKLPCAWPDPAEVAVRKTTAANEAAASAADAASRAAAAAVSAASAAANAAAAVVHMDESHLKDADGNKIEQPVETLSTKSAAAKEVAASAPAGDANATIPATGAPTAVGSPPPVIGSMNMSIAGMNSSVFTPLSAATAGAITRPVVLVRGDMDALKMPDGLPEDCPYRSVVPGVAHTCGHDAHVATVLYATQLIARRRHLFRGEIRMVFQPAEETTGGAKPMVAEGVADGVHAGLSLHVMTWNEVGTVAVRDGMINASEDSIYCKVIGDGGHAAEPWLASNPIVAACSMVSATHSWLAKTVEATKAVVLTISSIESGSAVAVNVIPETCSFTATLRCLDENARKDVKRNLPAMWESLAKAFECRTEVKIVEGYASGRNDPLVTNAVRHSTSLMYGSDAVVEIPDPEMGSEDFFEFSQGGKIPVCQLWLGGANEEKGITGNNHCPDFDMDEDCLPLGTAVLAAASIELIHCLGGSDAVARRRRHRRGPANVPHMFSRTVTGNTLGQFAFEKPSGGDRRIPTRMGSPVGPSPSMPDSTRHLMSSGVAAALSDQDA